MRTPKTIIYPETKRHLSEMSTKKVLFLVKNGKNAQTSEYSLKHLKPATYGPPLATYSVYDICHHHFWPTTGTWDAKNRNKKLAPPSLEPRIWGFGFWGFEFWPPNHSATRDNFELQIVRDPSRNSRPNNKNNKNNKKNACNSIRDFFKSLNKNNKKNACNSRRDFFKSLNKIKTCTANAGPKGFDSGLDLIST